MDRTELKPLGQRITARREAQGWSEDRLAKEAGVAPHRLRAIEAGEHDPAFTVILRIARALGCPVAALLDDDRAD